MHFVMKQESMLPQLLIGTGQLTIKGLITLFLYRKTGTIQELDMRLTIAIRELIAMMECMFIAEKLFL